GRSIRMTVYLEWTNKDIHHIRAIAGMPNTPLHESASYVLEGQVDLHARTEQLAKSIHAGAPDAMSGVVFPGTARTVRVTDVQQSGNHVLITGELGEQSSLLPGESPNFSIRVDRSSGLAHADFLGSEVVMRLDK